MAITGRITEVSRAMQTAEGLLRGIAADKVINAVEIQHLREWLSHHKALSDVVPFSEVYELLESMGRDQRIERSVHAELLDFCEHFSSETGPIDRLTKDIRVLHGLLQGIAADGVIDKKEVNQLQNWLETHEFDRSRWPFWDIGALLDNVLKRGKISSKEQKEFLQFCSDFSQKFVADYEKDETTLPNRGYLNNDAPIVQTIHDIVDQSAAIVIRQKSFCFTGQMKAGKRREIETELAAAGGIARDSVTRELNYLVIGANSNPCWVYSTYGRKIEKVMQLREKGASILILHEDRFLARLRT